MKRMIRKGWLKGIIGLLLVLLILKAVLLWAAKPKITVDYVAEYNKITRPQNYDLNENAVDDYRKAFDAFNRMPDAIHAYYIKKPKDFNNIGLDVYYARSVMSARTRSIPITWPKDLNDTDQNSLGQWLASNMQTFEYFRTASRKPYYWLEGYEEDNEVDKIKFPETGLSKTLIDVLSWNAKWQAIEGHGKNAFDDILTCYRAGQQKCRTPSFLREQLFGIRIKRDALSAATEIIDRVQVDPQTLSEFQKSLQAQFDVNSCILNFKAEKLGDYDKMQRIFVYTKKGTGRIACRFAKPERSFCDGCYQFKMAYKLLLTCLFGPTQNEMIKRIEDKFASYEAAVKETPWQLHLQGNTSLQSVAQKVTDSHCGDCSGLNFDEILFPPFYPFYNSYYRLKAQERALLTIIAIHLFKAEKGKLPEKLDELVSAGYLQTLPLDPYSDGTLVYRVEGDNFTLYSIGENFKDDGGFDSFDKLRTGKLTAGGKELKNPSDDIIFWPVKHPDTERSNEPVSEKPFAGPNSVPPG